MSYDVSFPSATGKTINEAAGHQLCTDLDETYTSITVSDIHDALRIANALSGDFELECSGDCGRSFTYRTLVWIDTQGWFCKECAKRVRD